MKHGEATVSARKTAIACARAGAVGGILLVAALLPLPLDAAIDRDEPGSVGTSLVIDSVFPPIVAVDSDDTLPPLEDQIPALAQGLFKAQGEPAKTSEPSQPPSDAQSPEPANDGTAKDFDETLFPSKELGLMDRVQDWLARANREFQFTIIRRLSTAPAGGGGDDIARKLEEVKEADAEAAADRAEEAIKAAQAKQAAEAKHRQDLAEKAAAQADKRAKTQEPASMPQVVHESDDHAVLAEEMRKNRQRLEAEAEAQRIEEQRKLAEEKRKADEQKRLEDSRVAQMQQAKHRAAEEKKAADEAAQAAAAKEAAGAKEKELAVRQAAQEEHQRQLADAAQKAADEAKRVAGKEETAKAAAEARRQADAQEAARKVAAEKEAAEKAKEIAAKEDADAQRVAAEKAAKMKAEQKQAMVEDEDKDDADTSTADAAPAVAPSDPPPDADEPDAKPEERSDAGNTKETAHPPRRHDAHASREARNHLARGPVVKRWIRRARPGRCRFAGRKILLPGRYTVARGDTLSLISLRHYRTSRYYFRIYRANRDIIGNPNRIYPCERLYLPRRRG
jgi:nucleoid-associated protein YgaU